LEERNLHALLSNGDAVTATDVQYSFDSQSGKYASPTFSSTGLSSAAPTAVVAASPTPSTISTSWPTT